MNYTILMLVAIIGVIIGSYFIVRNKKDLINIIFPILLMAVIFYSGSITYRINQIRSEYTIDIITINNSFITKTFLTITGENTQKVNNIAKKQNERFNEKYEKEIEEIEDKNKINYYLNYIIYTLILILIINNVIPKTNTIFVQSKKKQENKAKILEFLRENGKNLPASRRVTNNDVEKLCGVSDSTAERYLDELEKEGKIKQIGATGQGVFYRLI